MCVDFRWYSCIYVRVWSSFFRCTPNLPSQTHLWNTILILVGEVILFAAKVVEIMKNDGLVVLLEGREQTVNYVRTPHRFTLTLSDSSLIGKRRAAQRLMAEALSNKKHKLDASSTEEDVAKVLEACLEEMVKEE